MGRVIDEVGNRYGRLIVLDRRGSNARGEAMWLSECRCGNLVIVRGTNLRSGNTKSCGCLQREKIRESNKLVSKNILPSGEGSFSQLFAQMKYSAKRRGYEWQLTKKQTHILTQGSCFYCGIEPLQQIKSVRYHGAYLYNGLDRIDNRRGYTIDNVVPCCSKCNYAKHTMQQEEFKVWIRRIYEHFAKI